MSEKTDRCPQCGHARHHDVRGLGGICIGCPCTYTGDPAPREATEEELRAQRAGYVKAEMAFGTDRQEAEEREATEEAPQPQPNTYTMTFILSSDLRHVLLLRKPDDHRNPIYRGRWTAPGGSLEKGESEVAGASRELREETGIVENKLRFVLRFACNCDPEETEHEVIVYSGIQSLAEMQSARGSDIEPVGTFEIAQLNSLNRVRYLDSLLELVIERMKQPSTAPPPATESLYRVPITRLLVPSAVDEATEGFNAIFPWVPQAEDENGNLLTLADKIEILGKQYDDLLDVKPATESELRSQPPENGACEICGGLVVYSDEQWQHVSTMEFGHAAAVNSARPKAGESFQSAAPLPGPAAITALKEIVELVRLADDISVCNDIAEIAEKAIAESPTGQPRRGTTVILSRDAEEFYALPECPACGGSGKVPGAVAQTATPPEEK
jgi:ADP-ribose pyrophosphatase YjhB (NUDIX family)